MSIKSIDTRRCSVLSCCNLLQLLKLLSQATMKTKKIAQKIILSAALLALSWTVPASAYQSPEAQQFMSGFNSFKNRDYTEAIQHFTSLLNQPDSQLRELSLIFLARSYFKNGKIDEAAYLLHTWEGEFPGSDLKNTLEQDLVRETGKVDVKAIIARKEQERIAREKAEQERLAALKAEEERKAREKAEAERIAKEKAEQERLAALKAEEERKAREKAEVERIAREKFEAERLASHKAVIYAAADSPGQILTLPAVEPVATAARETLIPLAINNPGILPDSFKILTDLPASWKVSLVENGKQIEITPEIAPGSSRKLYLSITLPPTMLDGQSVAIPLQIASNVARERTIPGELRIIAAASLVRAVVNKLEIVDNDQKRAECLVSVLNVGSADAEKLTLSVAYSTAYEPQKDSATPFRKGSDGTVKIGSQRIASGELQEYRLNFRLKGKSPAKGGIACKASISME